jgi:hypothetical protein
MSVLGESECRWCEGIPPLSPVTPCQHCGGTGKQSNGLESVCVKKVEENQSYAIHLSAQNYTNAQFNVAPREFVLTTKTPELFERFKIGKMYIVDVREA